MRVRALEPRLRLGWSLPRASRDYTASWAYALPAFAALPVLRRVLPETVAAAIRDGRIDAVMAHWRLVDAAPGAGGDARPAARSTSGRSTSRRTIRRSRRSA